MDKVCEHCHRLPLRAGGCTTSCAIIQLCNMWAVMEVQNIVLNTIIGSMNTGEANG